MARSGSQFGGGAGISNPPSIDPAATGQVATLRTGLKGTLTWSKLSGASSITIASQTGAISLSAAIGSGNSIAATFRVQNTAGDAVERTLTFKGTIAPPTLQALTVSQAAGTVGTAYEGTISGRTAGSTLSLTGQGAEGLSISGTTISGTPTKAGKVTVVEALDGATNTPRPTTDIITIAAIELKALTVAPAVGNLNTAYEGTITGRSPNSQLKLSGPGAAGLSITGSTISGTPTAVGSVSITETLDGASNTPRLTADIIAISSAPTLSSLSLSPATAQTGTAYNGTITKRTNGSTLTLNGPGAEGLSISGNTITGTPTKPGWVSITETHPQATNPSRTSSGLLWVANPAVSPLKTAMVQNRVPTARVGASGRTRCRTRWPLIVGCDITSLVADLCATFMGDTGGQVPTYTLIEMAIEDVTANVSVPVKFGGARSVSVPSGTIRLASDEILATAFGSSFIPAGRMLHVKCVMEVPAAGNGLPYSQRGTSDGNAQVGWYDPAATTISSVDTIGAFTHTGTTPATASNGFCPIVRGRHVRPTVAFMGLGDSIMEITADGTPQVMGRAFFQKAMRNSTSDGGYRPSILAAKVGALTGEITSSPFWKEYLDAVDVVISEPGTNDISGWTVAQGQRDLSDLWAIAKAAGKEVYQTNWQPRTSSSDWETLEGQTPRSAWAAGAIRDQLIAWFETKVRDGTLTGVIDTLSATGFPGDATRAPDNTRWNILTGRRTSDGTHPYGSTMEDMAVPLRAAIARFPVNGIPVAA